LKNWTHYVINCKEVIEAGFKVPIPDGKYYRKNRKELAKFILDNMKGANNA
jgi:hypothetical protein